MEDEIKQMLNKQNLILSEQDKYDLIYKIANDCGPDIFHLLLQHDIMDEYLVNNVKMRSIFAIICAQRFDIRSYDIINMLLNDPRIDFFGSDESNVDSHIKSFIAECFEYNRNDYICIILNHSKWSELVKEAYQFNDLHIAIMRCDINLIKKILEDSPSMINNANTYNSSPLHLINYINIDSTQIIEILKIIIHHPQCNINQVDKNNRTLLYNICESKINEDIRFELICMLMEHPSIEESLNKCRSLCGYAGFHWICYHRNLKLVKLMLADDRINPGLIHISGTAFHSVCDKNEISDNAYEITKLLLEDDRIDPNYFRDDHRSIISIIEKLYSTKHVKILKLLLDCDKIKPFKISFIGQCSIANVEIYEILLQHPKIIIYDFQNLLQSTIKRDDLEPFKLLINHPRCIPEYAIIPYLFDFETKLFEVIEILLKKGIKSSTKYNDYTLFHCIYAHRSTKKNKALDDILLNVTKLLITNDDNGDFTSEVKKNNRTPLHDICHNAMFDILMYLFDTGKITSEQLKVTTSLGKTLLHSACSSSHCYEDVSNIIKFLTKHVDFTTDNCERTPFHYACESINGKEICQLLFDCVHEKSYMINQGDSMKNTPLHNLCNSLLLNYDNYKDVHCDIYQDNANHILTFIKYLLSHQNPKIDINVKNHINKTCLTCLTEISPSTYGHYAKNIYDLIEIFCFEMSYDELYELTDELTNVVSRLNLKNDLSEVNAIIIKHLDNKF